MKKRKKRKTSQIFLLIGLSIFAIACMLPLCLVVIASFSSERSLAINGFTFFPSEWSLDGWKYVLGYGSQLQVSYGVTIFITVVGTFSGLLLTSMTAYTLARRHYVFRNLMVMLLLIPMLFSGGLLSSYMVNTQLYHLKDTLLVLWLPSVGLMNVVIMRTYIYSNITDSLIESAKIDGAGELRIYVSIVMPLMKPVLASLGYMSAVGYWNSWQGASMYITSQSKVPLQLLLMRIEKNIEMMNNQNVPPAVLMTMQGTLPEEATRMAMLIAVLGPIMIAYPFFQKYFVKGLTMGAIKG